MSTTPKRDPWEVWFERYRGTELAEVVVQLARAALERGQVTAEDAHCIPVTNPSIRGAAMRRLRAAGILEKQDVAYGSTDRSHGHVMFKWTLADAIAAQSMLRRFSAAVLHVESKTTGQLLMAV